jgi:predicted nucleotidyltransferase
MELLTPIEKMAINRVIQHLFSVCRDQLVSVILYGSKARGDFNSDSDIDLLILVRDRENIDRNKIYDFLLDDDIYFDLNFSLNIYSVSEFQHLASINAPFAVNIIREGETLWTN